MRLSLFLISMVILLFFCSLLTGHTQASVITSLKALISGEGPLGTVMQEIRLPRAILAVLIGGSLGCVVLQCRAISVIRWQNLAL